MLVFDFFIYKSLTINLLINQFFKGQTRLGFSTKTPHKINKKIYKKMIFKILTIKIWQ